MLYYLTFAVSVWLCAADKYAACNLDPHCREIANLSESHTTVMRMIKEDRIECKLAGMCPNRKETHNDGRIPCDGGQAVVPGVATFECNNVDLLSFVSLADLGCNNCDGNDIWGWTDPENGDLYAIAGTTTGTSIVRVTDPEHPVCLMMIDQLMNRSTTNRFYIVYTMTRNLFVYVLHITGGGIMDSVS